MGQERLQKIIAAAGIASRRKAEELITSGAVSVNGHTITELGAKADAASDDIRVSGRKLSAPEQHVYVILNKPKGYVTTTSDPEGRPTVMDLVHIDARGRSIPRLFPVGRLDFNSEGLLVLTNDGGLANKLTHASSLVPKTYMVKVSGTPTEEEIERLRQGVSITADHDPKKRVRTAPARIRMTRERENPWYEVTLIEGRNRQIRKMFEEVGHHVEKIRRVRYGALELRNLDPGEWRFLTPNEVRLLHSTKQLPDRPAPDVKERSRRNRSERFHTGEYPQNAAGVEHRHDRQQPGARADREKGRGRRDFSRGRDERGPRRDSRDFVARSNRRSTSGFESRPPRRDFDDEYGAASIPSMGAPTEREERSDRQDNRRGQSRGNFGKPQRGKFSRNRGDARPQFGDRRESKRSSFGKPRRDERPSVGDREGRRELPSFGDRREGRPSLGAKREGRPQFGGKRRDEERSGRPSFGKRREEGRSREDRPSFGKSRADRDSSGFGKSENPRSSRGPRDSRGQFSNSRGPSSSRRGAPSDSRGTPRSNRGPRSSGRSGPTRGSERGGRGRR